VKLQTAERRVITTLKNTSSVKKKCGVCRFEMQKDGFRLERHSHERGPNVAWGLEESQERGVGSIKAFFTAFEGVEVD